MATCSSQQVVLSPGRMTAHFLVKLRCHTSGAGEQDDRWRPARTQDVQTPTRREGAMQIRRDASWVVKLTPAVQSRFGVRTPTSVGLLSADGISTQRCALQLVRMSEILVT